jgi:hypothetical protein
MFLKLNARNPNPIFFVVLGIESKALFVLNIHFCTELYP